MALLDTVLEIVFPRWCCGCNAYGSLLCGSCFSKLVFSDAHTSNQEHLESLSALVGFEAVSRSLIHQLKYNSVKDIAVLCARLMFMYGKSPQSTIVTSVPLHPIRQRERGFNQAEILAKEFARLHQLPYFALLRRTKHDTNLATITDRDVRAEIIANQFELIGSLPQELMSASLIIIDDVWTTGSTLNEAAKVLRIAGVQSVTGVTFAHGV